MVFKGKAYRVDENTISVQIENPSISGSGSMLVTAIEAVKKTLREIYLSGEHPPYEDVQIQINTTGLWTDAQL
jgi:hypothetical protein